MLLPHIHNHCIYANIIEKEKEHLLGVCNIIDSSDVLDSFSWSCHSCLEYESANLAGISFPVLRELHLAAFAVVWKKSRWQYWTLAVCILWGDLALQYILFDINTRVLKYDTTLRELWLFLILKQQFGLSLCCCFTFCIG